MQDFDIITPVDVVVVAPHPDDAELGMGGTILKMVAEGLTVGIADMTNGEPTPFGSPEIRAAETSRATAVLGITWRINLGLPNRELQPTLEGRARLAGVLRLARPRAVFCPYWEDAHPDHLAATEIVEAARFWAKLTKTQLPGEPYYPERIFYYFCTHLRNLFIPNFVVDISGYFDKKMSAVRCYESQVITGRQAGSGSLLEHLHHQAATLGWTIGVAYAEGFAVRESLPVRDLNAIIPPR